VSDTTGVRHPLRCIDHDAERRYTGRVKVRELTRLLAEDGWRPIRQKGSHVQFRHPTKPGVVTVAGKPSAELPLGTALNILAQAGLRRMRR